MVDSGRKKNIFDKLFVAIRPKKEVTDIVEYAERILREADRAGRLPPGVQRREYLAPLTVISIVTAAIVGIIYGTLKIFL